MELRGKRVLITGAAGFIGGALALHLLRTERQVTLVGLDSLSDYYDPALKEYRLKALQREALRHPESRWSFYRGDIAAPGLVEQLLDREKIDLVVHLAAQAGVRHSITHPEDYMESNVIGFFRVLEACRRHPVEHLVYASSSSVYGDCRGKPGRVNDGADAPVSLYAATKRSGELMAHAYAKLYGIPCTGLRFFTVYGPAGRPDMAYFSFAEQLRKGGVIRLFNRGQCRRDFTFIDDVTEGLRRVLRQPPAGGEPPCALYNLGGGRPRTLLEFTDLLEEELGRAGLLPREYDRALHRELVPMEPGDVTETWADPIPFERDFGFRPEIPLEEGLRRFVRWYGEDWLSGKE